MAEQTQEREVWGSRIGFILSTIGMAFGLGAIWRFPYVAAESGGGAFILFLSYYRQAGLKLLLQENSARVQLLLIIRF